MFFVEKLGYIQDQGLVKQIIVSFRLNALMTFTIACSCFIGHFVTLRLA